MGELSGSKLSEAENKAKEPAILRKGISEKGNCRIQATQGIG